MKIREGLKYCLPVILTACINQAWASQPLEEAPAHNSPEIKFLIDYKVSKTVIEPLRPSLKIAEALKQKNTQKQNALVIIDDTAHKTELLDLTAPTNNIWDRMRQGFSMPDLNSRAVTNEIAWFLNHPRYINRVVQRGRRYLYHVVNEIQKRQMPTELALLPIIESAYNPLAESRARALGMWQFIPSTGRNFNLEQNWWLDQRRDVIASTSAALNYLESLYRYHGDWLLALASYNYGEYGVARAIRKNQKKGLPIHFSNLRLPKETRAYVPKLIALKRIISQPELYGIELENIPNEPYFETVDFDIPVDLAVVANLAEMPLKEIIQLNPAYHRPVAPPTDNSVIAIQADRVNIFRRNLANYQKQAIPLSQWKTYIFKRKDSIYKIAKAHKIPTSHLRRINGLSSRRNPKPGSVLLIPNGNNISRPIYSKQLVELLPKEAKKRSKKRRRRR